jgi:putative hemolysin
MTAQIIIVLVLILINGLFAMSEIVIVSSRKTRLQQWANEGSAKAKTALDLAQAPTLFLSTVQAGITLIGIMVGALGEAALSGSLAEKLHRITLIAPYSTIISLVIVVIVITYVSLIIGELVPKRLGLYNPELLAVALSPFLRLFSRVVSPLVKLLSASTDAILWSLRAVGIRQSDEPTITQEEIKVMIEQGTAAGTFEEAEQDIIERVFSLNDQRVGRLMIPRTKIVWLDINGAPASIQRTLRANDFTRFPVCDGDLDKIVGVIHVKSLLDSCIANLPLDLKKRMRPPIFVPKQMPTLKVLELFKQSGMYLAIVIDEYGSIIGLVSLNDILEAIIGNLSPVDIKKEPQVARRDDGSWLMDGMLPIARFKEIVGAQELPGEEKFQTLGGFIMAQTGLVPKAGDHFDWEKLRFEVIDMDGNRVDKVLVGAVPT